MLANRAKISQIFHLEVSAQVNLSSPNTALRQITGKQHFAIALLLQCVLEAIVRYLCTVGPFLYEWHEN